MKLTSTSFHQSGDNPAVLYSYDNGALLGWEFAEGIWIEAPAPELFRKGELLSKVAFERRFENIGMPPVEEDAA
jgi:hypothetical protein